MSSKSQTRIAIVNSDKCQPSKCKKECQSYCPVNTTGKECVSIVSRNVNIETETIVKEKMIANISELFCIGCNACVKRCPYSAIQIIRLPTSLPETVHRYTENSFKLCNIPIPRKGSILGLVGQNGVGKSTSLFVLSGKIIPNFGNFNVPSTQKDVIKYFRGTELQNYFSFLYGKNPKILVKPQYVESIKNISKGIVSEILDRLSTVSITEKKLIYHYLEIDSIKNKNIEKLSGGELQRFTIAVCLLQEADIYMLDEPTSYLDIKQRVNMSKCIREILIPKNKYVIVIEHDVSILDYLSDYICCLYGDPGVFGIVSPPFTSGEGINVYLDGYIPTDNTRFRHESLDYKLFLKRDEYEIKIEEYKGKDSNKEENKIEMTCTDIEYPMLEKKFSDTIINISPGKINSSEIICLVGENGTGKTTFIKMLCGLLQCDNKVKIPLINISYKPQIIEPKFKGTVQELLYSRIAIAMADSVFKSDIIKPLGIERLYNNTVTTLSGGEIQKIAIVLALGKPADVYLIDEPSAYLDVDQRIVIAKAIKKFIKNSKKYCFLVEHDFIMSTYLADRVIVFSKTKSDVNNITISNADQPIGFIDGFNNFLKELGITFRRSKFSMRPRINKEGSATDREQKRLGKYFITDELEEPINSFSINSNPDISW